MIDRIIFPTQAFVCEPMLRLIRKLEQDLLKLSHGFSSNEHLERLAVSLNQSALVYTHLGRYEIAKQLCESAIYFYFEQYLQTGRSHFLTYIPQPWVNLARLDIINCKYDFAYEKLLFIMESVSNDTVSSQENPTISEIIRLALAVQNNIGEKTIQFIYNVSQLEILNMYLRQRDYSALLTAFPVDFNCKPAMLEMVEAQIIALTKKNQYDEAISLARHMLENRSPFCVDIFMFRLIEIYNLSNNQKLKSRMIDAILKRYSLYVVDEQTRRLSRYFRFSLANLLITVELQNYAKNIYEEVYVESVVENDEWGQYLALSELSKKFSNTSYQDKLQKLITGSYYSKISKRALSDCPVLQQQLDQLSCGLSCFININSTIV